MYAEKTGVAGTLLEFNDHNPAHRHKYTKTKANQGSGIRPTGPTSEDITTNQQPKPK